MNHILFILLLTPTLLFAGPREEAQDLLNQLAHETELTVRLDKFSNFFLGLPYGDGGPLGEGEIGRYDQDPLYRFDTFDCTTYVETIMALALARDITEFEIHLNQIRYRQGQISYLTRNHFTDLQWIPFNIQNGYLSEANERVLAAHEIKMATAEINLPGWLRSIKISEIRVPHASHEEKEALLEELHSIASDYNSQDATVPYIPIAEILKRPELLHKIPSGTLVNFVRPNWDLTDIIGTHQNISHQGFLFRKNRILFLRHASSSGEKKVLEIPFIEYLKKFDNHPTLKGIHLMQLNE